jgi:hypothetical protein
MEANLYKIFPGHIYLCIIHYYIFLIHVYIFLIHTLDAVSITHILRLTFFVSAANYSHLEKTIFQFFSSAETSGYFFPNMTKIEFFLVLRIYIKKIF